MYTNSCIAPCTHTHQHAALYTPSATHSLHPGYSHPLFRSYHNLSANAKLHTQELMYPIFVHEQDDLKEQITSLPNQFRWGVNRLEELVAPLVANGLTSVLLFGVITSTNKTPDGSFIFAPHSPIPRALKLLASKFPQLLLAVDVCLCGYTDHGHCGILKADKSIDNQASIDRLAAMSLHFAEHGAQLIAPSDMMDGRIGAIKAILNKHGYGNQVAVMSYAAKFASCYYGPFRDAAGSGAKFGNREAYQLPVGGRGLALRAVQRDLEEGADFVMVKPGGPYLDIVRDVRNMTEVPIAIYQVSGEYAMLYYAANAGAFGLLEAVTESLISAKRAGATILITYFAPYLLEQWNKK